MAKTSAKHYNRNHNNIRAGKTNEKRAKKYYKRNGYDIVRDGWGSDFRVRKNGKTKHVEVKTGTSYMTKKQMKTARRHGRQYEVYHVKSNGHAQTLNGIRELEEAGLIRKTLSR